MSPRFRHKQGSSLVESCIVMALLCLVLFGLLNVSYIVSSRNIINYASVATARARSVGLNDFMLYKVSHYATIPTAGPVRVPAAVKRADRPAGRLLGEKWSNALSRKSTPRSQRTEYETGVKQAYHLSNYPYLLMDYENWSRAGETDVQIAVDEEENGYIAVVTLSQQLPLTLPFSRVFFWNRPEVIMSRDGRTEEVPAKQITATTYIEDHSQYYLKDML